MATEREQTEAAPSGLGKDLAGIPSFLFDPEGAAPRVHSKWFWIGPVLISCIAAVIISRLMIPFIIHAAQVGPTPNGVSSDQYVSNVSKFAGFGAFIAPVFILFFNSLYALVLLGIGSLMSAKATFGKMFNLVTGCGIIQTLGGIATYLVLYFKGEVQSMAELKPPMGPDIFLPERTNKYVLAAMSGFSIFQIWWVVMMALIFAAAFRVSKGKGFVAVLPLWLATMCFSILGAMFQK